MWSDELGAVASADVFEAFAPAGEEAEQVVADGAAKDEEAKNSKRRDGGVGADMSKKRAGDGRDDHVREKHEGGVGAVLACGGAAIGEDDDYRCSKRDDEAEDLGAVKWLAEEEEVGEKEEKWLHLEIDGGASGVLVFEAENVWNAGKRHECAGERGENGVIDAADLLAEKRQEDYCHDEIEAAIDGLDGLGAVFFKKDVDHVVVDECADGVQDGCNSAQNNPKH